MQRTVELLLGIGILLNLCKGADLILRPHQQKWIQEKTNQLAKRLDYTTSHFGWYFNQMSARLLLLPVGFVACGWFYGGSALESYRAGGYGWILFSGFMLL